MKKLVSMYQKYMFRPILYKSVTRVSVVAVLMLLWDRYVSDGTFTMWQAPDATSPSKNHSIPRRKRAQLHSSPYRQARPCR